MMSLMQSPGPRGYRALVCLDTKDMISLAKTTKPYKLISCEIFHREMCLAVAKSTNTIDPEFLPKGLHDIGCENMLQRLQEAVDRVDASRYEAVLLGYALCSNGICGLQARSIPIVIPRAHDCITLFLGSRQRYLDYFTKHPGTYFLTSGWIERDTVSPDLKSDSIPHQMGMDLSYEELVAKYGQEDAAYLYETLCDTLKNYNRIAYIEMGLEPDDRFEQHAQQEAKQRGWSYEKITGDMSMIQRLTNGPWDAQEFLALKPGQQAVAQLENDGIIGAQATP